MDGPVVATGAPVRQGALHSSFMQRGVLPLGVLIEVLAMELVLNLVTGVTVRWLIGRIMFRLFRIIQKYASMVTTLWGGGDLNIPQKQRKNTGIIAAKAIRPMNQNCKHHAESSRRLWPFPGSFGWVALFPEQIVTIAGAFARIKPFLALNQSVSINGKGKPDPNLQSTLPWNIVPTFCSWRFCERQHCHYVGCKIHWPFF